MRNKLFFLLFSCLIFPLALRGTEVLTRRLSVSFHDMPVKQALDEIARKADFEWSYNSGILNARQKVSLTAVDWTVREILREMLGEQYSFRSNGRYLILKKEKVSQTQVSGVIRTSSSGERLANVTVYDRKTLRATTTDSTGFYQLKVKKNTELVVVRLGFKDTILQVASLTPRYRNLNLEPVEIPVVDTSSFEKRLRSSFQDAATELDYFFNTRLNQWHELNVPDTLQRHFQISFLPMVGTNHILSKKVENDFSINVLAGQSAGVRGVELAGLGNFTQKRVRGFQAAGLFNLNRGTCRGVQAAGLFNRTADTLSGVQAAGLLNVARRSPKFSLQAAGLLNVIRQTAADTAEAMPKIVQAAGLMNAGKSMVGVQAAGLINVSKRMNGVQAAGLINTVDRIKGAQTAGLINVAGEVEGAQVSGLVNHAKHVKGLQIGLINITNNMEGVQIGLLNRVGHRWLPFVNGGWKKRSAAK